MRCADLSPQNASIEPVKSCATDANWYYRAHTIHASVNIMFKNKIDNYFKRIYIILYSTLFFNNNMYYDKVPIHISLVFVNPIFIPLH